MPALFPADGWVLHIIDTDPTSLSANGWLEDTSKARLAWVDSQQCFRLGLLLPLHEPTRRLLACNPEPPLQPWARLAAEFPSLGCLLSRWRST